MSALDSGGKSERELRMQKADGTGFTGYLYTSCISKGVQQPTLHVVITDVTQQREAEAARRLFAAQLNKLTRRERDVLALALNGVPNHIISGELQLHRRTIENHRTSIHRKTGVASLLELAKQAAAARVSFDEIALPRILK